MYYHQNVQPCNQDHDMSWGPNILRFRPKMRCFQGCTILANGGDQKAWTKTGAKHPMPGSAKVGYWAPKK